VKGAGRSGLPYQSYEFSLCPQCPSFLLFRLHFRGSFASCPFLTERTTDPQRRPVFFLFQTERESNLGSSASRVPGFSRISLALSLFSFLLMARTLPPSFFLPLPSLGLEEVSVSAFHFESLSSVFSFQVNIPPVASSVFFLSGSGPPLFFPFELKRLGLQQ